MSVKSGSHHLEAPEVRETLLELIRFKSTKVEGLTSLADAKSRMQPEQMNLYYITGGSEALLRNSPLLEVYKKKDIEILILDDDIDEIVFSTVDKYVRPTSRLSTKAQPMMT